MKYSTKKQEKIKLKEQKKAEKKAKDPYAKVRRIGIASTVAAMIAIMSGTVVLAMPAPSDYDGLNPIKRFSASVEEVGQKIEEVKQEVQETVQTAKDYKEAVSYVSDHKEEISSSIKEYKDGKIDMPELVDEIAEKIDVEYVYDFVDKYVSNKNKQLINEYTKQLEEKGVDINKYLPEVAKDQLFEIVEGAEVETEEGSLADTLIESFLGGDTSEEKPKEPEKTKEEMLEEFEKEFGITEEHVNDYKQQYDSAKDDPDKMAELMDKIFKDIQNGQNNADLQK